MVDYQSRYRLYGLGYSRPLQKQSVASYSELYKATAPYVFKTGQTPTHDCRLEVLKEASDRRDWETQLLCHGLRQTCADIHSLHTPAVRSTKTKWPDKLLFHLGRKGDREGDFTYPRAVTLTDQGDLVVADTGNHRVQVLNQYGVFKFTIGKKGSGDGEFDQPTGVTVLPSREIVVADSKNRRLQIFHPDGGFKMAFPTFNAPFSVACDRDSRIVVGTTSKTVEMYRKNGTFHDKFHVKSRKRCKGVVPVFVCCNGSNEIIVLDPVEQKVKYFSDRGHLLRQFSPVLAEGGLTMAPSSICVGPMGNVVIGDSLNHSVSLFSEQGVHHYQILGPTDNLGPVQSCSIGPEGHLAVTEFSVTGDHCVKIFRYNDCICHDSRPGSSKRRELTSSSEREIAVTYRSGSESVKSD